MLGQLLCQNVSATRLPAQQHTARSMFTLCTCITYGKYMYYAYTKIHMRVCKLYMSLHIFLYRFNSDVHSRYETTRLRFTHVSIQIHDPLVLCLRQNSLRTIRIGLLVRNAITRNYAPRLFEFAMI